MRSERLDLVLVRHGLTDWNETGRMLGRLPVPLNERGRRQAQMVAEALRLAPIGAVISSPQLRARQTATPIARAHGLPVEIEEALSEVWLGPRWEGKRFAEIAGDPDIVEVLRDPSYVCDAVEPVVEVRRRVCEYVECLHSATDGTVVLVSHGDPLRVLIAFLLSVPIEQFRSLVVSNAAVSILRLDGSGVRALVVNWRPDGNAAGWALGAGESV